MPKWSNVGLPETPDAPSEWFTKVLEAKNLRQTLPMKDLALEYQEIQDELDIIAKRRSELTAVQEALDRRIREELAKSGSDIWRGEGQTFFPTSDLQVKVKDKISFLDWVRATGQEALLAVMPGTVKTLAKEALDPDVAAVLTPAQRASLKAGEPGSGAAPPGLEVTVTPSLGRRTR